MIEVFMNKTTQPTTADVVIRIVGYGLTSDSMYFNPENDFITHS